MVKKKGNKSAKKYELRLTTYLKICIINFNAYNDKRLRKDYEVPI